MSRLNIVHRDLKPENILLNSKDKKVLDVRIADFGFAMVIGGTSPSEVKDQKVLCGTPGFISPEALRKEGYNLKSDIFSVGAILFSVLTKKYLFDETEYNALMKQNKACSLSGLEERLSKRSLDVKHFLRLLLNKEPSNRPSPKMALSHPWFQNEQVVLKNSLNMNRLLATEKSVSLLKRLFIGPFGNMGVQDSQMGQDAANIHSPINLNRVHELSQSRGELGFGLLQY